MIFQEKIQPDWWSKSFAGWILGLSLSIACAALITLWGSEHLAKSLAPQIGMWSVPCTYLPLVCLAYFIPRGWQAVLLYSVLNVIAFAILFALRG